MSRYNEYENRLHRIVLYSADVLPEKVGTYLSDLAKSRDYDTKKDVISEFSYFKPLVDSIPVEFVDFVISVLIQKPINYANEPSIARRISRPRTDRSFGIEYVLNFSPPAPVQGSFLYLLLKNEDEGLRLVHALTNTASEKWREYKQREEFDRPKLTPLPVTINLPSGLRYFWGDAQVYCWFRGTTVGPYPVISALMALEEWMERQIEAGKDVEALFEKVLCGSTSVAVLGICLSMALAYPEKCLKVALPIAICPDIWGMDISRLAYERNNSWNAFKHGELDRNNSWLYDVLERRNKRSQRSREIRVLAMYYILSSDDSLRVSFEQAVEKFTENLPFRYQEEKLDPNAVVALRENMENYQVFGRRTNYRQQQAGEHLQIWVEHPEEIKKRNEEFLTHNFELQRSVDLYLWAEKTIKNGRPQEGMALEEAVAAAKDLQTSEDFVETDRENIRDVTRLQAIAGVAAAILIANFEWATTQNHLKWCRSILLDAARMNKAFMYAMIPFFSVKIYAGKGLALLAICDPADIEIRQQILQLIGDSLIHFPDAKEVVKAVFSGLQNSWNIDPVLCWNAFSLCLSLSLIPEKLYYGSDVGKFGTSFEEQESWENNVIQNHFDYLAKDEIPKLPRVCTEKDIVFVQEYVQYGLDALPLTELCRDSAMKDKLVQLCDDLVARTIADNMRVENDFHSAPEMLYTWNSFMFEWAASLAKSLNVEETRQHILKPLRNNWDRVPKLTANLLDGYISHQIAYVEGPNPQALEIWEEICRWVLDSSDIIEKVNYNYLNFKPKEEVLLLIIFTHNNHSRIKDGWQHAHLFIDIFDKWVTVVGHNPYAYTHLLTMLNSIGWQFSPEPTLKWLNQCATNAVHDLWNGQSQNGERTAKLLNRIWSCFEQKIRNDKTLLQYYSNLVEQLVKAGIPLAGLLQHKLEDRE